jgi:hypothetical protein
VSAKLVELIEVEEHGGKGTESDPHRIIKRFYTKEGEFVCERDTWIPREPDPSASDRVVHILVTGGRGGLEIVHQEGYWEKGCTYLFKHPAPSSPGAETLTL